MSLALRRKMEGGGNKESEEELRKERTTSQTSAPGHGAVGLELMLIGVVSLPAPSLSLCNLA